MRTVVGIDPKRIRSAAAAMRKRFGQTKPQLLQLVPDRDQRTPTTRTASRTKYLRMLERVLGRSFPDFDAEGVRNAMDLEHSFGPAYARGERHLVRGGSAWAVIGIGSGLRTQSTIDGVLTLGILSGLLYCREMHNIAGGRGGFLKGLKVVVPAWDERGDAGADGVDESVALAKWELYELDERD